MRKRNMSCSNFKLNFPRVKEKDISKQFSKVTSRSNRLAFENRFDMSHAAHYVCNVTKYLELIAIHFARSAHKLLLQQILVHQISGYILLTERLLFWFCWLAPKCYRVYCLSLFHTLSMINRIMLDHSNSYVCRILSNNTPKETILLPKQL